MSQPNPKRFEASKRTLFVDRFMTFFIRFGGVGIVAVVFSIFVFILWQIWPLFQTAEVKPLTTTALHIPEKSKTLLMGADEWSESPFLIDDSGRFTFYDLKNGAGQTESNDFLPSPKTLTAFEYNQEKQQVVAGTADGYFTVISLGYRADFSGEARSIDHKLKAEAFFPVNDARRKIREISYGDAGDSKLVAVLEEAGEKTVLRAVYLKQSQGLMGSGEQKIMGNYDLSDKVPGHIEHLLVKKQADGLIVTTREGGAFYFRLNTEGDEPKMDLFQTFQPFEDLAAKTIATVSFIFGDVSLVFTSPTGENRIYSLYARAELGNQRLFGKTKEFEKIPGGAAFEAKSSRNKAFLVGKDKHVSLRYATTEAVRWQKEVPFSVEHALIAGKYNRILLLGSDHTLHTYELKDPHPESSFKAFFGKLWFEGSSEPKYEWQSTGGTDDFEPKLSLIPLIIGTLKGTLYALLFAVPIALLAALYTSQFLYPDLKVWVKPTMEIMASLPSVVLGFLAALFIAPLVEEKVPSLLLIVIFIPLSALLFGSFWSGLPMSVRNRVKTGYEFLAYIPIFLLVLWLGWSLGPIVEKILFVVTDPATGARVADFRQWWPAVTHTPYEQRNSLVVGLVMGFAVMPLLFTIAEDALSNVPDTLRSGALALGASRWQTAVHVILPSAFAGIFSAIMIGFGRAVGETMIVVMATGNTPIMDFNIFNGMRTLSANIAVELPEAPEHGTLYRTLFFGAMLLFLMTFAVNTVAEVLRQYLREKYKNV